MINFSGQILLINFHKNDCFLFTFLAGLLREGEKCWDACNGRQGPCDFCGNGLCCRKDYSDQSNGCFSTAGVWVGGDGSHVCVAPPGPGNF